MRALLLVIVFFCSGLFCVTAQNSEYIIPQNTAAEGTFQIQVINSRSQPIIPANINELVTANRNATEIVYVQLGTDVRLKILPLSEINRPEFTRLEKVKHFTE